MAHPNIFRFATSELSQDAMIAWLMECAGADDAALRKVGRRFILFLRERSLQAADEGRQGEKPGSLPADAVVNVSKVETQYQRIDIYCLAEIDGKRESFVIEDKTGTTQHGNQLQRYREVVRSDGIQEDYINLIYLKTGMPYKDELCAAKEAGYGHVGVHDLNGFLDSEAAKSVSSDLLCQYRDHIAEQAKKQHCAEQNWNMDEGPIQYRFAERLKGLADDKENPGGIWRDRSRGGSHWTQYRFFGLHLFWRMDSWGPLRLMVDTREGPPNPDIDGYRNSFCRVCKEAGVTPYKVRFRRGNEMTIGAIQYPEGNCIGSDVEAFLEKVTRVHTAFLGRIAEHRG